MLLLGVALVALLLPWTLAGAASGRQSPLLADFGSSDPTTVHQKHIAIIGAGIGGAATAFEFHESNRNRPPQKITIFERESDVGGRIQSIYLYPSEGRLKVVEDGATRFFTDDWCLTSAMQNVGLKPEEQPPWPVFYSMSRRTDDNVRTDLKCNAESKAWQDFLYGRWKYGRSWPLFHSAVRSALEKWNSFGSPRRRPFNSIVEEFDYIGILKPIYGSSITYFRNLTISSALQNEFIQPCTRGRFSQNLLDVSGLSTLMAAGKSTTISVDGGNNRLVERMIRLSKADLQLDSVVTAISPGLSKRYQLSISHLASNESSKVDNVEFDMVVLAAPFESSEIDLSRFNIHSIPTPRIDTYVTHFSSSVPVSSNLSVLPLDISILDEMTLTTSTIADNPNILNLQESNACFRRGCLPGDECDECDEDTRLYRVHSRQYLADDDLVRMIGQNPSENRELSDYGIHFVRRRAWPRSYPQAKEGYLNFVDDIEIAPDLYYLNGAESIICSMEMSCRMGRNVADKAMLRWSPRRM